MTRQSKARQRPKKAPLIQPIEKDEAVRALGEDRLALLLTCLQNAWSRYDRIFRPELPLASPTGIANMLHELAVDEIRKRFSVLPNVTTHENVAGGRFLVQIDNTLLLQFKKLDHDFVTSNYPTDTAKDFDAQREVAGMPPLPRLTIGYQLGNYRTELAGIYLAFIVGRECVWYHDLRDGTGSNELVFPRTTGPSVADQEAAERREAKEREEDHGSAGTEGE